MKNVNIGVPSDKYIFKGIGLFRRQAIYKETDYKFQDKYYFISFAYFTCKPLMS